MSLALSTLLYEWRRYMAAIVALASAGVLVLGMSGLFVGLLTAFTATIDRSRADIMILPPQATSLLNSGGLPARLLPLIYVHPSVTEIRDLDGSGGQFFGPRKKDPEFVQASVVDPYPDAVTLPTDFNEEIRSALAVPFNIAVDRSALNRLGVRKGDTATFNGRVVRVAAILDGYPNFLQANIIMSRQTLRLLGSANTSRLGPLMVRLDDPKKAEAVRDELNAIASNQYRAWTRAELRKATISGFLSSGFFALILGAATALGLFVGVIITWQTLRAAILANIKEFASLRALGVSMGSLRWVVLELSFWVGVVGLAFTAVTMLGIKSLAGAFSIPIGFAPTWVVIAAALLMIISLVSGFFSLGVLKKSQPADLLR